MMHSLYQRRRCILSRLTSLTRSQLLLQRLNHTGLEEGVPIEAYAGKHYGSVVPHEKKVDMSKWKKVNAKHLGIKPNQIPDSPLTVLKILRYEGFKSFLVGGCVRDLILNRVPKDFDVITSAGLSQIKKVFRHSMIVGRKFPICMVTMKGSVIEVSSFETRARHAKGKEEALASEISTGCNKMEFVLWRDSMNRDFTINSLFFDPFKNVIYDYANGMEDLRALNLRTLIPAQLSFQEDCARILRALRIVGRLGLSISPDTETAIHEFSSSVASLDQFRLMLEINYMLCYGASEATISLLQKFNLLGVFLPFHAAYFHQQSNENSIPSSMMVMKLLHNLDRLVSCAQPCSSNLWLGVFSFHQALVINPQDSLVIWAFASTLYRGNWEEGLKFAKDHEKLQVDFDPEILRSVELKSDNELADKVLHFALLVQECVRSHVNRDILSKFMSRYPACPCSDSVLISKKLGQVASQLFDVLAIEPKSSNHGTASIRKKLTIDYKKLGKGSLQETRFVLGKIILETLSGGLLECTENKKRVISPDELTSREQGVNKKLKLDVEQKGSVKRLKDESRKMTRKPTEREETSPLPNAEQNRTLKGSPLKGKQANIVQKRSIKAPQEKVEERHRDGAGEHLKAGKDRRRKVEKMKLLNERECQIVSEDMASNKRTYRSKSAAVEEGRSERTLSSMFR